MSKSFFDKSHDLASKHHGGGEKRLRKSKIIVTLLAVILVSLLTFGTSVFSDTDGDLVDEQDVLDYYYPNEPDTDYEPVVNEEQTEHTTGDTDGDLVDDAMEYYYYGTDPLCPDTDGDGLTDCEEIKNGFDPLDPNNS
jgi:hypothetical protein